jgi:hypothetical protein
MTLKPYQPTPKGRELIAILFPLSHPERETNLVAFRKQYPSEIGAVLDGFHFLIQELIEARETGDDDLKLNLPDDLYLDIFRGMKGQNNHFAYPDIEHFLSALNQIEPPLFDDPKRITALSAKALIDQPTTARKHNLPKVYDETVRKRLEQVCSIVSRAFNTNQQTLPSIRNAQKTIDQYQRVPQGLTLLDLKLAEATLAESRDHFDRNAKIISQHWPYVYEVFVQYPEEIEVLKIYINFLAKLLASREARQPTEKYVLALAEEPCTVAAENFKPTKLQLQRGITSVTLAKEYRQKLKLHVARLESRYRKRKLMVKLKENAPKALVIKELLTIAQTDPQDIRTMILLARLFGEYAQTISDHKKRTNLREQALKYSNLAFSTIDDYLDLQQIEAVKERDQMRAGFVKTISSIRLPLLRK